MVKGKINLKKIVKYTGNTISALAIICLALSIYQMDINIDELSNKEELLIWSILGIIIAVFCLIVCSYAWMQPLQCLGNRKLKFADVMVIYLKSNLGKYLPGNIVHYVERNLFAVNMGIKQLYIAISSVMECMVLIIVAMTLSILFSYKDLLRVFDDFNLTKWLKIILFSGGAGIVILGVAICCLPKIRNILADIKKVVTLRSGIIVLIKMILSDIIILYGNGLCFALICRNILGVTMDAGKFMYFINCYVLAWMVGYCTPGAPGGIGIRELIIILLVRNVANSDMVVLSALIHRIVTVLGDFLAYCISIGIGVHLKKQQT